MKSRLNKLFTVIIAMILLFTPLVASGAEEQVMVFPQGEGFEQIRQQQERLIAEAIAREEARKIALLRNELKQRAEKYKGRWQGQCVIGVRKFIWGQNWNTQPARSEVSGGAKNLQTNNTEPTIGAIVLLDTKNPEDHVAVVIDFDEDSILVYESNYIKREVAGIREIPKNHKSIIGYRNINY